MKQLTLFSIAVCFIALLATNTAIAQFNIKITVNSGSATTTCTDPIGTPDPMWSVNIENAGWVTYPSNVLCYNDFPNVQYDQTFLCINDIPSSIQVCFRAFENDASFLDPCNEVTTCMEETCINVPVPPFGSQNFDIQLPDGLGSDGEANLTIETTGIPGGLNDLICNAIDIGVIENGMSIGDADTSVFNNFCASNLGEPNPWTYNGSYFTNHRGVWFKFTANSNPQSLIKIEAKSDPSNFGDPIDLELGVFRAVTGNCVGPYEFFHYENDNTLWDETIYLRCPQPDETYYILVDGDIASPEMVEGYFGIELTEMDIPSVGNLPCEATEFGPVPPGGSVGTPSFVSNGCADGTGDPPASAFGVQAGVWFSFDAPPSGHVLIEGVSDIVDDEIGLQLALFSSSTNDCNGVLTEVISSHTSADLDETMDVHCLEGGQTYFLLIDGAVNDLNQGMFTIDISDAGDETVTNMLDTTICAGEMLDIGGSIYSQSGIYEDTFQMASGCDSIVISNLTVLNEVLLNFAVTQQGLGPGNTDGQALVAPAGGTGNFNVQWDNGQTTNTATGLVGGDTYCVVVSDDIGCLADTCFEMPYYLHFEPEVYGDTVDCNGDQNGILRFTAASGQAPYAYNWQNSTNTISGSGTISFDGQIISVGNLPAGDYFINMTDIYFDTTVVVEIAEPDILEVAGVEINDASCYGNCDGIITLEIVGGTEPYQVSWSNGDGGISAAGLCAGSYNVVITDANGCMASYTYPIIEPPAFIAEAAQLNPVSCFEGSDGSAEVTTNGNPAEYLWSYNNVTTAILTDVPGGIYTVTVTNSDGCTATTSVEIFTPEEPVLVSIEMLEPIICRGEENGVLQAVISGPGTNFTYSWSTSTTGQNASGLGAGTYSVAVENELGCQATASFTLQQPDEINVDITTNQLTCFDPPNGGIISIDNVSGGMSPYLYSSNGALFTDDINISGYTAGPQTFYVQDALGCIRSFQANIEGPTELLVDLGEDQTIDLGDALHLDPLVNIFDVTYQWSPEEDFDCPDCAEQHFVPIENTLYTVTVTDEYGCTAVSDVFVSVLKKRKVYVPNAFSPNGDGINDEFMPYTGNDVVRIYNFRVFDRQGNNVYTTDVMEPGDVSYAWDGTFKGILMQPSVFVWLAEIEFIDGEKEIYKGDVTLIR